jgi:hypothetical protein
MTRRILVAAIAAVLSTAAVPAQTPGAPPPPPPAPKMDLPSGDSVLKRYVEATGGAKAYDAVKTQVSTGTLTMAAQGITGSIKIYTAVPAKSYSVVDIQNVGKIEDGSDGKIAWEVSGMMGSRIKTGDEAAADIRSSAMDLHTNWKKYYKTAEVTGIDTVGGKACYKVVLTPFDGAAETQWYDKETSLLVKEATTLNMPMGTIPAEITVSDYRKNGDLLLPFHVTTAMGEQQFEIALDKIDLNVAIPDSRFDTPADIKVLQK